MKLKTTLLGKTYTFRDIKQVLAKANEEKPATSWQAWRRSPPRSGWRPRWCFPL